MCTSYQAVKTRFADFPKLTRSFFPMTLRLVKEDIQIDEIKFKNEKASVLSFTEYQVKLT